MNKTERPEFVDRFEAAWNSRDPDRLASLLDADVRLVQPLLPELKGRAAARKSFADILELIPDLRTEVTGWSSLDGSRLYIEFTFSGTAGKRPVTLHLADRFELKDGLAVRRVSYFDPMPLVRAILTQPALLWKFGRTLRG